MCAYYDIVIYNTSNNNDDHNNNEHHIIGYGPFARRCAARLGHAHIAVILGEVGCGAPSYCMEGIAHG